MREWGRVCWYSLGDEGAAGWAAEVVEGLVLRGLGALLPPFLGISVLKESGLGGTEEAEVSENSTGI